MQSNAQNYAAAFTAAISTLQAATLDRNSNIPFAVGDAITIAQFTTPDPRNENIEGQARQWLEYQCTNGAVISATQIWRNNNGLGLQGTTNRERLTNFSSLVEAGDVTLHVRQLRQGRNGQTIVIFEPLQQAAAQASTSN